MSKIEVALFLASSLQLELTSEEETCILIDKFGHREEKLRYIYQLVECTDSFFSFSPLNRNECVQFYQDSIEERCNLLFSANVSRIFSWYVNTSNAVKICRFERRFENTTAFSTRGMHLENGKTLLWTSIMKNGFSNWKTDQL